MKPGICINPPARQRGDAFIEAMVGVVLTAVIGLGLSYIASRAVHSQRYLNTQNVVISQMRESLASSLSSLSELCTTGSLPSINVAGSATTTSAECSRGAVRVGVGGATVGGGGTQEVVQNPGLSGLTVDLPANAVVTSLTVSIPANETTAALVGGDGKMAVSL